jgi:acyl carrier protein
MTKANSTQILSFLRERISDIKSSSAMESDEELSGKNFIKDFGMDSLDYINLLFQIEEKFQIKIPEPDIEARELDNVSNLIEYISEKNT